MALNDKGFVKTGPDLKPEDLAAAHWPLERSQLDALVLGLPWQRIGDAGIITVL